MRLKILLLLLLILPLISAAEIEMKSDFLQGETLMARISGDFLETLTKENIYFYREPNVRISLDYDLARIDDYYYVYAQLGSREPTNYSMRIEEVRYIEDSKLIKENLVKLFEIRGEIADFRINPGFIITDEAFEIKLQNLQNFNLSVKIKENKEGSQQSFFESLFGFLDSQKNIELFPGEIRTLYFDVKDETSFSFIVLSTDNLFYEIPIYFFALNPISETTDSTTDSTPEDTTTDSTTDSTPEDTTETTPEENQTDYYNETLPQEQTTENQTDYYNETLPQEQTTENQTIYYNEPFFEEEEVSEKDTTIKTASTKTCSEMNGDICNENEKCEGTKEYAIDSVCCIGKCVLVERDNRGIMIGWIIIAVVLLFIVWFFGKKYKSTSKKEINLLDIAKRKR